MQTPMILLAIALFAVPQQGPPRAPIAPPQKNPPVVEPNDKPLELKGSRSGISKPEEIVVRDERSFAALWKRHIPIETPPMPHVDFKKHDVVAIFVGSKPTGGYAVEIGEVTREGRAAVVHAILWKPGPRSLVTQAFTSAFAMRSVPKLAPIVRFDILEKER